MPIRLKTLRYKLDGTTTTVSSLNVQDGGTILTVSDLSAGSHTISFVSATVEADGTGEKVLTGSSYENFSLEGSSYATCYTKFRARRMIDRAMINQLPAYIRKKLSISIRIESGTPIMLLSMDEAL